MTKAKTSQQHLRSGAPFAALSSIRETVARDPPFPPGGRT